MEPRPVRAPYSALRGAALFNPGGERGRTLTPFPGEYSPARPSQACPRGAVKINSVPRRSEREANGIGRAEELVLVEGRGTPDSASIAARHALFAWPRDVDRPFRVRARRAQPLSRRDRRRGGGPGPACRRDPPSARFRLCEPAAP